MDNPRAAPGEREQRFQQLFTDSYADVLRFVERRVHPSHAEDVAADTYVVLWRRLDDVPASPSEARAWIFGVARRVMLAGHRGTAREHALSVRIAEHAETTSPGDDAELIAQRVDLARAWHRLRPVHQESLSLDVWDGLSSPEAAAVLGISPVAYRLRLSRARRALRALLQAAASGDRALVGLTSHPGVNDEQP